MKKLLTLILCFTSIIAFSQTGTIKGKVIDKQSEKPVSGASVELLNVTGSTTITDADGNFKLSNVPLGRQVVRITFVGYENISIPDIDVTSGKDNILTVAIAEKFNSLEGVVVKSGASKAKSINKMAAVSVRQFSAEEANRYAGGRSDVSRLASNFAGVATADDSRNDIVVRGNSPAGLLWRLEGIPVPSPNHFATLGTTGSPVSALNPNLLANSDFITSAFPAEYGNAIGGVFDLGFRKGNTEKYEYSLGMAAFPGIEFMAEGPFRKKNGGSFVAAARYGVVGLLGLAGTAAVPNYNDLSFNIDFGKSKLGNISLFGIYGSSDIDFIGKDIDSTDLFAAKDEDAVAKSNFSAFGLKHTINVGKNSYLKTTIGGSSATSTYEADR
jgi:CarboxypepD_reg-like domain/TonB-dependent Receptor Plug Domain